MLRGRLFPLLRGALAISFLVSGAACEGVVSLDPAIGPNEAVAVPEALGDWFNAEDEDSTVARVVPGYDSASYLLELGAPMVIGGVSLGPPELELRLAPMGDGFLAEAIPVEDSQRIDSLRWDYGATVQLAYMVAKVKFVRGDAHVWGFLRDSVRAALHAGRCSQPGRAIDRAASLIFSGASADVRRTIHCLMKLPGVLDEPIVYRRVQSLAGASYRPSRRTRLSAAGR